jgi:hypothetical protein
MEKPDRWLLVRVNGTNPHWRIFATWGGGYTYGESWRLNSGVASVEEKDEWFDFIGHSGSVYRCSKTGYGVTLYGMGVLTDLIEKSAGKAEAIWEEPSDILATMEMV